jgi:hypothetical protein
MCYFHTIKVSRKYAVHWPLKENDYAVRTYHSILFALGYGFVDDEWTHWEVVTHDVYRDA